MLEKISYEAEYEKEKGTRRIWFIELIITKLPCPFLFLLYAAVPPWAIFSF